MHSKEENDSDAAMEKQLATPLENENTVWPVIHKYSSRNSYCLRSKFFTFLRSKILKGMSMALRSVSRFRYLGIKLQWTLVLVDINILMMSFLRDLMAIDQENSQQLGKKPSTPNDANLYACLQ